MHGHLKHTRCNTDAKVYAPENEENASPPVDTASFDAEPIPYDGKAVSAAITMPPYSLLVFSQDVDSPVQ